MAKLQAGLRNASGLGFSRECAPWFYFCLLCLLVSILALLGVEVLWRLPDLLGNYMVEAFAAVTSPVLSLVLADQVSLGAYQRTWFELKNLGRAPLLLDKDKLAYIRHELASHLLLRWFRPAPTGDLGRQLRLAAAWYDAVVSPEDAPWLRRYGAPLRLELGALLAAAALGVWGAAWRFRLEANRPLLLACTAVGGVGLAAWAVGQLRAISRRQAILDYFATYQGQRES
jgi:hypothetical protein